MKTPKAIALLAAALVLLGAGCSNSGQPNSNGQQMTPPAETNAYPGTEPYVAPTKPPPGIQPQ